MTDPTAPLRGAVDLAALAARSRRAESDLATIDEEDLQKLAERSLTVPVILTFVSGASPASEEVARTMADVVAGYGGAITAAACDVEAQPAIAQMLQVRGVPAAVALIGGRPAPLFQGNQPREQIEQVVAQVAAVAQQMGAGGAPRAGAPGAEATPAGGPGGAPAPEAEEPLPPLHQEAHDAIDRGDLAGAEAAFDKALVENPKDADARAGRAYVRLMARTREVDPQAVRSAAAADPADLDAQMGAADLDVLAGALEDAYGRLIDTIRVTFGDDRERLRARLIELFDVVDPADQRVLLARRSLASALY